MIIVEDTRNQVAKHKELNDTLTAKGFTIVRSKLFVGDYTRLDNQTVCIDTKKDINEIAGNICGKQHERFKAECIRARDNFIKLIVLIEEIPPNNDLDNWQSRKNRAGKLFTQVKGDVLKKAMHTMHEKYGVVFEFTSRAECANRIIDLLNAKTGNLNG